MGEPTARRGHLPTGQSGIGVSLIAVEEEPPRGVVVLYLAAIAQCAVPLTPIVRRWLRELLDELEA